MKQQLINNIIVSCQEKFDIEQVKIIFDILNKEMCNVEITASTTEVGFVDCSFEKTLKLFVATKRLKNCSENTIKQYISAINRFMSFINKPLNRVTSTDVRFWLSTLIDKNSPTSLNNLRLYLNSFFNWCTNEGILPNNPVGNIEPIKEIKNEKEPYSGEQLEILRNYFTDDRNRAIMEFLLSTGCRVGEMVSVNKEDLNFNTNSLRVYGEKGKQYRTVYLTQSCAYYIKKYLKTRTDDEEALFVTSRGKRVRLSVSAVQEIFRKASKQLGFYCHCHKFRRTMITTAANRGMTLQDIKKIAGHQQLDTTLIYVKTEEEEARSSFNKIFK